MIILRCIRGGFRNLVYYYMDTDNKKIKLLILIPNLHCGGSENYVTILCDHMDTDVFDITLAVLDNANPFYTIKNSSIVVIDLKVKRVRNSFFAIKKLVQHKQPDMIFSLSSHLNLYLAICRRLFPKKIKWVARESSIVSINNRRTGFPTLYHWLVKKFYRRFDRIICQSGYMQQDLIANFNIPVSKTILIHNPVESRAENNAGAIARAAKFKFITVARLSAEKGIDRLIRTVARLSLSFQYYIIGEGDQRDSLEKLILQLKNIPQEHSQNLP